MPTTRAPWGDLKDGKERKGHEKIKLEFRKNRVYLAHSYLITLIIIQNTI